MKNCLLLNNINFALFRCRNHFFVGEGDDVGLYLLSGKKCSSVRMCLQLGRGCGWQGGPPRNKLPARGSPSAFEGVGILPDLIVEYFLLRVQEGRNFIGRTGRRTNGGGIENRTQEVVGQENSLGYRGFA